jgi:16S rRNA (adenine1518-N6/adenine1519-N6)-dimethyltransferase
MRRRRSRRWRSFSQKYARGITTNHAQGRTHLIARFAGIASQALTQRLIDAQCKLTAIEYDHRLAEYLREKYRDCPNFRLIEGDACRIEYDKIYPAGTPWRCIANLPYSCGSVIIAKFCAMQEPPSSLHILLQREMGERLCAKPGCGDYGALTVRTALAYHPEIVRIVPPGVFFPPPEVDSAYVRLSALDAPASLEVRRLAGELAITAFAQRRKKAKRLLENHWKNFDFASALTALGLSVDCRAENISPAQYTALARAVLQAEQLQPKA